MSSKKVPNTGDEPEETPVVKSGFKKVKVNDFCGSYKDAFFNSDGVCESISDETLEGLSKQFPEAQIEEID